MTARARERRRASAPGSATATTTELLTGREMGRALGVLWTCGALLAFAWSVLPHASSSGDAVVRGLAGLALAWGATMAVGVTDRAPAAFFLASLVLIQVVIVVAYVAAHEPHNDMRLFFAWAGPYAVFFFPRRVAARLAAWIGLLMAAALAVQGVPLGESVSLWASTLGLVVSVMVLVGWVTTKMRRSEDRLQSAALHDSLTGLPNRVLWAQQVEAALGWRLRYGGEVYVLLVDLDNFKLVNDTHGHAAGDEILRQLALRLAAVLRPDDTVARLGGDEFAVVCYDARGALDVARVAQRLASAWTSPFSLAHGSIWMTGSVGVVQAPSSSVSAADLLRSADSAMYEAKAAGRNGHVVFDEAMAVRGKERLAVSNALHEAIGRDELRVVYQPVRCLSSGRSCSAEALVRWTSADLGEVSPADFIPLAEEAGLISAITAFVLRTAMTDIEAMRRSRAVPDDFSVSVNVSALDLTDEFPGVVAELLASTGLPARCLALEITETAILGSGPADAVVGRLRELGVSILLDDFGTGYSSLSHLERFPLDGLKIDRGFLPAADAPDSRWAVVAAVLEMARALGLQVVAEGVTTAEQAERLRLLGCDRVQGFFYGRPGPAGSLVTPRDAVTPACSHHPPGAVQDRAAVAAAAAYGPYPV